MTARLVVDRDREATADALLLASARHSFDPTVDVDWATPLDPDRFFMPPERVSIYGTPLWDGLDRARQIELSKHEVASTAGVGIWFEMILMQLLLRHTYSQDPTTSHVKYALTEIGDECRHSVMFANMITAFGCPSYGPGASAHRWGWLMKTVGHGSELFAAALVAEELLDTMQREMMADDTLQPMVRTVSRIHVVEEARHVRYAREELVRQWREQPRWQREYAKLAIARAATTISNNLVHPRVYAAVGIDPAQGRAAARSNPHRTRTLQWAAHRLVGYFDGVGLLDGPARRIWIRSRLLPSP